MSSITYKQFETSWIDGLSALYSSREALQLLQLALEDCLHISRIEFLARKSTEIAIDDFNVLNNVLFELKLGKPYQYIVGFTYFGNLKIQTTPSALIPRPETEELVHWIIETTSANSHAVIEDYCTGSGCIALFLKSELTKATIYASDISDEALELAKCNADNLKLDVQLRKEDVLNPQNFDKVDVIVSNPPYIPMSEKAQMHENVVKHEPELALFVPEEDPLLFYRKIAEIGLNRLQAGGYLFFELHEDFAIQTQTLLVSLGYKNVLLRKDLQDKWRMLRAER